MILLHQGCVPYNRIIYSKGIQVVLSTSKPNQLDTKGLPPAQGRNPSHNGRFYRQRAGSSLMKIGNGGSETLQVMSAFPKWVISDKRLPASPRSGSSRISDYQPPLGRTAAAPVCSSCLRVKSQLERGNFLVSFIKSQCWRT